MGLKKCWRSIQDYASFSQRFKTLALREVLTVEDVCQGMKIDFKQTANEETWDCRRRVLFSWIGTNHDLCTELVVHVAKHARGEILQELLDHRATEKMKMDDCDLQGKPCLLTLVANKSSREMKLRLQILCCSSIPIINCSFCIIALILSQERHH